MGFFATNIAMVEKLNSNLQKWAQWQYALFVLLLCSASLVCSPFYAADWHASPLQNTQKKQSNIGEVKIMLLMWSYITARPIKASYQSGNPCGCYVFCFGGFWPARTLFLGVVLFFFIYTWCMFQQISESNLDWSKNSLTILHIVKGSVYACIQWFYIPVHIIILTVVNWLVWLFWKMLIYWDLHACMSL